jgi:hypothetical protein
MGDGTLVMLWSSTTKQGYAMGQAHSLSGRLEGPWIQNDTPLIASDGGHGMVFEDMSSQLKVVYHAPNSTPHERLTMIGVVEDEHWLKKKTSGEEAS